MKQATPAPPQVTPQVTPQVARLLRACTTPMLRTELQGVMGLSDRKHFRTEYLDPALRSDLIERTIPDKPNSRLQKCRLTQKGIAYLKTTKV